MLSCSCRKTVIKCITSCLFSLSLDFNNKKTGGKTFSPGIGCYLYLKILYTYFFVLYSSFNFLTASSFPHFSAAMTNSSLSKSGTNNPDMYWFLP